MALKKEKQTIHYMKKIIEAFKMLDLKTTPIKEIEEVISKIGALPVAITDFDNGKIIHRARRIKKGENLTSVEQLSFYSRGIQ